MPNIDMLGGGFGMDMVPTDPRWTPTDVVNPVAVADFTATQDIRTLDAKLTALNAGYWTTLRLNSETTNDKIFWLRSTQYGAAGLS